MATPPPTRPAASSPLASLPIEFIGSFPDPRHPLDPVLPEVAFLGRSNVGKSSLINALTGRRGLARVSATPGKTQTMNVFRLPEFYLVDLPGYGYAKASKQDRSSFARLVRGYLETREHLAGLVWLLDIRHAPTPEDVAMLEVIESSERPVLAVLTKADKLAYAARQKRRREVQNRLQVPEDQLLAVSSTGGLGIADLGESVVGLVSSQDGKE
ncbi:MAG: ribosome biogenesis GTP-binding protein YihA/YsxC [Gemmatimonadales bacterium]